MAQNTLKVVGMMSGTSLDGLDLAFCEFWKEDAHWRYKIGNTHQLEYPLAFRNRLEKAIALSATELLAFHAEYGSWLGKQAREFITANNLQVDAIASHGHTVHHRPEKGFTFQLGCGHALAKTSGVKTIADFRSQDVSLGGQGAPLVPIGDRLLLHHYDYCLNLGGIANISFEKDGNRMAYDIGVANMALNYLCLKLGKPYDNKGAIAASGRSNQQLLKALNALDYYKMPYPKSTGYEWVHEKLIPLLDKCEDSIPNLLHTCVDHISDQVAFALAEISDHQPSNLLVTGGGGFNNYLMQLIEQKIPPAVTFKLPDPELINYKEALVFAFMGALKLSGAINVLKSVTGAEADSCSGVIYEPAPL